MTEALAVLEKQLDEQHAISKSKSTGIADSTSGGNTAADVPIGGHATARAVSLLWTHLDAWRGIACRRILSGSIGAMGHLPVFENSSTGCDTKHCTKTPTLFDRGDIGPKLGTTAIYREVRRSRARVKVVSLSMNGSRDAVAHGERETAVVALRWARDRRSAECSVVKLRDTLSRMTDESPAFKARRSQH